MAEVSTKRKFVRTGYTAEPTLNGGVVLLSARIDGGYVSEKVSFTTPADMMKWLSEAYEEAKDD